MKTLSISLCLLLAVAPLTAQQMVRSESPNFYVPYGVRGVQPTQLEEWSTSALERQPTGPEAVPDAPQLQRHPVRRGGYPRFRRSFGYPAPEMSPRSEAVMGLVMIGIVAMALAAGDR